MTAAPKLPELISGALFDFLGFLTTLDKGVTFGASHEATPAVELLSEWAAKRGLELDEARVRDWSQALAQPSPGAVRGLVEKVKLPRERPENDDLDAINETPFEEGYDTGWNDCLRAVKSALAAAGGNAIRTLSDDAPYEDYYNELPCLSCGQSPGVAERDAVDLLHDLVTELEGAFISSWQSTHAWQKQLTAARVYLDDAARKREGGHG